MTVSAVHFVRRYARIHVERPATHQPSLKHSSDSTIHSKPDSKQSAHQTVRAIHSFCTLPFQMDQSIFQTTIL